MALTKRGTKIQHVNNANSATFSLTAGWTTAAPSAGDTAYIFVAHGFDPSLPSGWTSLDASIGQSNVNGRTFKKILTSGDITTGSITINFSGTYYGIIAAYVFQGSTLFDRTQVVQRNSSGAGPRTLTTDSSPKTNDFALYFSMIRLNNTITVSRGTGLEALSNTNASGVLKDESLGSNGSIAPVFTFGATPTGDYDVVLVIADDPGTTPWRATQLVRMSLFQADRPFKASQLARLTLHGPDAPAKISQLVRLVLRSNTSAGLTFQVAQLTRLSLLAPNMPVKVTQVVRLVLMTTTSPEVSDNPGFTSILW